MPDTCSFIAAKMLSFINLKKLKGQTYTTLLKLKELMDVMITKVLYKLNYIKKSVAK